MGSIKECYSKKGLKLLVKIKVDPYHFYWKKLLSSLFVDLNVSLME